MSVLIVVLAWMAVGLLACLKHYDVNWKLWRKTHPGVANAVLRLSLFAIFGLPLSIAAGVTLLYRKVFK